jgi:hypothetical protein
MDRFVYSLFYAFSLSGKFLLREMAVEPVGVWIRLLVFFFFLVVVIISLFLYFTYGLLYYVMD